MSLSTVIQHGQIPLTTWLLHEVELGFESMIFETQEVIYATRAGG